MMRRTLSAAYGRTLRAIYSRSGVPWRVHDEIVRIDPDVRHLVPHEPEPELFHGLRRAIRPGDVVLDVGAFLGVYAILAARWSGGDGRVVAFEPTPASAAIARRHCAWNGPQAERIEIVEAAVSDRPARATLYEYGAQSMPFVNSLAPAVDAYGDAEPRDVRVLTIDEACEERGIVPSVVRMDVQGAEVHALRGAARVIARSPRLVMIVEMHPQCWPAFGITEQDARSTIADLGLTARPLTPGDALFARDGHLVLTKGAVAP
jgi:FkbM family methyltransferase